MNKLWEIHLNTQLQQLKEHQLLRQRGIQSSAPESQVDWLDFGSNDYLGLSRHPQVVQVIEQYAGQDSGKYCKVAVRSARPKWGSGASPVLSGYCQAHQQLELSLAELSDKDSALVFSSGYACNVGSLSCLADQDCIVFSDQLNHASLIDGLRLGRALRIVYPHSDVERLEQLLIGRRSERVRALIVTESIFSMDGDEAPLGDLANLAERFDCGLIVDEAHAVGAFGRCGGGLLDEVGLTDRVLLKLGTLSKALGGVGGYAVGNDSIIEYLVNRSRSYVFSTALPALAAIAANAAIGCMQEMHIERKQLADLSRFARSQLVQQGWLVPSGRSPIVPMIVGDAQTTLNLSRRLLEQGIYVPAIRPPTVPENTSRLRVSLSVKHSLSDIERLVHALEKARSIDTSVC